jgi:hypothetical protein
LVTLLGCGSGLGPPQDAAEIVFPVFSECSSDLDMLREVLLRGGEGNSLTVETFDVPIKSHSSLIGVGRARVVRDELMRVPANQYLRGAVSSMFESCMPNLGTRIEIEGFSEKLRPFVPAAANYAPSKRYYAIVEGDSIGVFFNDGSYNYSESMRLR